MSALQRRRILHRVCWQQVTAIIGKSPIGHLLLSFYLCGLLIWWGASYIQSCYTLLFDHVVPEKARWNCSFTSNYVCGFAKLWNFNGTLLSLIRKDMVQIANLGSVIASNCVEHFYQPWSGRDGLGTQNGVWETPQSRYSGRVNLWMWCKGLLNNRSQ